MDSTQFDDLARTVGRMASRRTTLRAALGALVALPGIAELRAKGRRVRAAGPCGDGGPKANECEKDKDCCTRICKPGRGEKGRCRCKKRGQRCKATRNCCKEAGQQLTCQSGTCQRVQTQPSCVGATGACTSSAECCPGRTCTAAAGTQCCSLPGEACSAAVPGEQGTCCTRTPAATCGSSRTVYAKGVCCLPDSNFGQPPVHIPCTANADCCSGNCGPDGLCHCSNCG